MALIDLLDWRQDCEDSLEYLQAEFVQNLNCNGRNYMAQEEYKNPGLGVVAVLIKVNDFLDALCFHLPENPILCNIHQTSEFT